MAKIIIEFDTDNDDDMILHKRYMKSTDMTLALFEITVNSKKRASHIAQAQESDSDIEDGVYIAFKEIARVTEEYNINIDYLL